MLKAITSPRLVENDRWPQFHAIAMLLMLLLHMLYYVMPTRWFAFYESYGRFAVAGLAVLYFYRQRLSGRTEIRLMIAYAAWFLITRVLNGDTYLQRELGPVYEALLVCIAFPTGLLLDGKGRERLMNWLTVLMGGFFTLLSLAGIFTALTYTYIRVPPELKYISLLNSQGFVSLSLLSTNRNGSSAWIYLALCLMIYQFFHCRGKLWRIPVVLASVALYLQIGLCMCRTIQIVTGVNFGMLVLLLGLRRGGQRRRAVHIVLCSVLAAAVMLAGYFSFGLANSAMSRLASTVTPAFAEYYAASERKPDPEIFGIKPPDFPQTAAGEKAGGGDSDGNYGVVETRNIVESATTLSLRTYIWEAVPEALRMNPSQLFIGEMSGHVMDNINIIMARQKVALMPHMHNMFFQILMLTGLPGVLLALAIVILLALRMIRLFFGKESVPLEIKILTLPLTGMLIYSMLEVSLFSAANVRSLTFFILAGIMLAYYYDFYPACKPGRAPL